MADAPVDPVARKALDDFKKLVTDAIDDNQDRSWRIGSAYSAMVADHTAQRAGFATTQAFVEAELAETISHATLAIYAVAAAHFQESVAVKHHVVKLAKFYNVANAENLVLPPNGGDPGDVVFSIGKGRTLKFADCTMAELNQAWAALAPVSGDLAEAQKTAAAWQKAVEAKLGSKTHVRITAARHGGSAVINVTNTSLGPAHGNSSLSFYRVKPTPLDLNFFSRWSRGVGLTRGAFVRAFVHSRRAGPSTGNATDFSLERVPRRVPRFPPRRPPTCLRVRRHRFGTILGSLRLP